MNPRYSVSICTDETYENGSYQRRDEQESGREVKKDYFYDLIINRLRPFFLDIIKK